MPAQHTDGAFETFQICLSPVFNGNMFVSRAIGGRSNGHGRSVKVLAQWNSRQIEQGRRNVNVCRNGILDTTLWNTRPPDKEWHSNVLFKPTGLPGWEAVLSDMVSVVRGVDDVSIVQLVAILNTGN